MSADRMPAGRGRGPLADGSDRERRGMSAAAAAAYPLGNRGQMDLSAWSTLARSFASASWTPAGRRTVLDGDVEVQSRVRLPVCSWPFDDRDNDPRGKGDRFTTDVMQSSLMARPGSSISIPWER
ncbi:MAG: hypothetical protein WD072_12830 [Pirellulales bacterium]